MIRTALITAAIAASAGAALLAGAGTALAPEPVQLTQGLGATSGATAAAVFTASGGDTTVVKWPGTWTAGSVPAGKPCSTTGLVEGQIVTRSIQAYGSYRKCL